MRKPIPSKYNEQTNCQVTLGTNGTGNVGQEEHIKETPFKPKIYDKNLTEKENTTGAFK